MMGAIQTIKKLLGIRQGWKYYNSVEMVEAVRFYDFVEGQKPLDSSLVRSDVVGGGSKC